MPAKKAVTKKAAAKKALVEPQGRRPRKPRRSMVERVVNSHLENQHVILYGRAFDINSKDGRADAVQFLSDFYEQVNEQLR